jgi:hypothetical protein
MTKGRRGYVRVWLLAGTAMVAAACGSGAVAYGADFVAQLEAAAWASVSISVAVEADATVWGAASSGY